jgi:hypothetical protein
MPPYGLLGLLAVLFLVIRERIVRPPVLRLWEDGSNYALRVRRCGTGAVLYQVEQNTLTEADLRGRDFSGGHLQEVSAARADLRGANLNGANLSGADLTTADLRGATLRGARLHSTNFLDADLRGADLCGADRQRRDLLRSQGKDCLVGADLRGARYSASTRWPRNFDPEARGCVRVEESHADLPLPTEPAPPVHSTLPIPRGEVTPLPQVQEVSR